MITRKKAVPGYAVNKSRHVLSLSLVALLGAAALGTGPAFAADGIHCVHTIDYNKLSASELEMLYRDIDVHSFADNSANRGKCVAAIDYNKLSAEELEMINRDINVYPFTSDGVIGTKFMATIDFNKLSAEDLDKIDKGIDVVVVSDEADNERSASTLTNIGESAKGI